MSVLVPLFDELTDPIAQILNRFEVRDLESFPLENAEPLFDLVHPRAVDWGKVKKEAAVFAQPLQDLFPLMNAQVVADNMDLGNMRRDRIFEVLQEGDELYLPFPSEAVTVYHA